VSKILSVPSRLFEVEAFEFVEASDTIYALYNCTQAMGFKVNPTKSINKKSIVSQ
jgi:hypothetical protein